MFVLCLVGPTAAHAGKEQLHLAIGGGVDAGDGTGWSVRFGQRLELTDTEEGLIYGTACGYDYWRAGSSSGFNIPIGGFVGARTHDITTTFGAGIGVLAFESNHDDDGFGIVPYVGSALGFELAERRTITIDARISRHVLLGADDFSRWSVLVMYGGNVGH
jgi:hypothetical protein